MKLFNRILFVTCLASTSVFAAQLDPQGLTELSKSKQQIILQWLNFSLEQTQATLGPLPYSNLPIYLHPRYIAFEPVPWGSVRRGDPGGIELHFDRFASFTQLRDDWTLYHEMAHLYLPLLPYSGFWLSEGFATYMQNIIMRDSKVITREQFIQRLSAGLERGRQQTRTKQQPLSELADDMWQQGAQQRVYWSGSAFFIEAELALQQQGQSLTQLIKRYRECCYSSKTTAKKLITTFDQLSRSAIFSTLYARYTQRTDFPDITREQLILLR
ncbi:hypothetical protein H5154_07475 [Pseudoalteromonas sp. SR44-5]|uniref:M61 family metallopeptidase n=1 Tax=unclassified Pseudoalteromonas TaxID=194690 RepID=UPI001600BAAE|nr:hypothetical protein [Pseudoalteromonas sp. SR44-5]MBB1366233.1 hypothetical protein [Pseudoalteromonas sp. SR44-5]